MQNSQQFTDERTLPHPTHAHRRRLLDRELSLNERFKESEGAFDKKFQAMIARRVSAEEKLRELEAKPPKDLADYILALEREEERDGERNEVGRSVGRSVQRALIHSILAGHLICGTLTFRLTFSTTW